MESLHSAEKSEKGLIKLSLVKTVRAKRWQVLRRLLEIENFPKMMPNVKRIDIVAKEGNMVRTRWFVNADGIPISWVEEEIFDYHNFCINFRAVEGDFQHFDGEWKLIEDGDRTRVEINVRMKIGIPMVEGMIAQALADKVYKNFNLMLEALNTDFISRRYKRFRETKVGNIKGFSIIGHPYNLNNLIRYFQYFNKDYKAPSREFLMKVYEMVPSYVMREIAKFTSKTGKETHGLVIVSTFIPDMVKMDIELVIKKVVEACRLAEEHNIGVVSLGGFTSIAGERFGEEIKKAIHVPITTGNTYTASLALDGIFKAAEILGVNLAETTTTIIGGTGDIGGGCAQVLKTKVKKLILTGRQQDSVDKIAAETRKGATAEIVGTIDNMEAVKDADIVIAAASVSSSILDLKLFKPGSIVCDLAYPKNISYMKTERQDMLIFSGGLCDAPCDVDLGFEIGLPTTRTLYGCFAECIILDLEGRYESYSYGRGNITPEKVEEIRQIGLKHGFQLAPFFWGDEIVSEALFDKIRSHVRV